MTPCKEFEVTMRPTEASERCRLRGSYVLRARKSTLELWSGTEPGTLLYDWPYRFLRRFGRDKVSVGVARAGGVSTRQGEAGGAGVGVVRRRESRSGGQE